jgi:hypothetical protein
MSCFGHPWAWRFLFLLFLSLSWIHPARAESSPVNGRQDSVPHRVVLLAPQSSGEVTTEALARVKGELAAAGFEVVMGLHDGQANPRVEVESSVRALGALAALAVVYGEKGGPDAAMVELWVSELLDERTTVQRLTVDRETGGRGAAVLAVHAVDLLRAALAEYWILPEKPVAVAKTTPAAPPAAPPARQPWRGLGMEAGAAAAFPFGAMPATWAPLLKLSYGGPERAAFATLSLSGLGSTADRRGTTGAVHITQGFATLGAGVMFRRGHIFEPVLCASAGAYRLHAQGTGDYPNTGRHGDLWSVLTGAGAGLEIRLGRHFGFLVESLAFATWPQTVVRIADAEVARAGRVSLMLDGGLVGRL